MWSAKIGIYEDKRQKEKDKRKKIKGKRYMFLNENKTS